MERVRRGPYRFLNHPNYVVVALETVALPLAFGAWRTAFVFSFLNALMMRVRIGVENQALKELR
jgi:methyltransferase